MMLRSGKNRHKLIRVTDGEHNQRDVCRCQVKEQHQNENGTVSFPVYECPWLTEKKGYGTEHGLRKV